MPDYRKMYSLLFNEITDVMSQLRRIQIKTEEIYMDSEETPLNIVRADDDDKDKSSDISVDDRNNANKA